MIMQIDTKNISGKTIEIKLETAYRFWDLDFAGMDYSNNENIITTVIEPEQVIKSDSTDQKQSLLNGDAQYVHLVNNEYVSFKYAVSQPSGDSEASWFLVSGGYYHSLDHITGKPNYNELYKFKKPGYFDEFSRAKYKEVEDIAAILKE
jgi:hypothetical protein